MPITEITTLDSPHVRIYASLTEAQLRKQVEAKHGIFIAESPKVIMTAIKSGYRPLSMLCERKHIDGDASAIIERCEGLEVFTASRELLESLTGYKLTRGVLCAMERSQLPTVDDICRDASRLVVIDSVCDTTNIGAIFRSAAALGIDGILLTKTSCDPLNRRALRVSMGAVLRVPWTWLDGPICTLKQRGLRTVAMALTDNSISLDDPALAKEPRLAIVVGTEGDGLSDRTIADADYVVRIPMTYGIDSLNVAAATAVACWQLCTTQRTTTF